MRALGCLVLAACAHNAVGELRFHEQPPIWRVNDRERLATVPAERVYNRALYHTDGYFVRRITRALDVRPARRAADVNSLDEVPDSTWFTNRIGVREMALDELRRANLATTPFEHRPWTITSAKEGGMSLGFIVEDAAGVKYILKFDQRQYPELETAAHVIVHRILWASGYNVPEDHVGYVRREDLVIGPEAKQAGYTDAKLDAALGHVFRTPDGRYRVLASRYVPGTPLGGYAREGTRPDDANDRIAHERRRSLRGQAAVFAWLNHTDLQEDNTLDMFDDGYVVHYLVDFGTALGVAARKNHDLTVGYTYHLDLGIALKSLLLLGLWDRPWERVTAPALRGVGLFEAKHYDPGTWRANSVYWPFEDADRFDKFWGAKLAMRFSRAQLAAIVDEAQLSDPRAAAYLVDVLVERQRKTARYWFARVAPIDDVRYANGELCFSDLTLLYGLQDVATRYRVEVFDRRGTRLGAHMIAATGGRTCLPLAVGAYTIARLRVYRNAHAMPPVSIHLSPRFGVIGLRRE